MQIRTFLVMAVLGAVALSGCLKEGGEGPSDGTDATTTSVFERADLPFDTSSDLHSFTLEAGEYDIITPGTQFFTQVALPPTEGAPAATGPVDVSIGVHFPAIPGCDWGASDLPEECHVPVIADIGPYYRSVDALRNQGPDECDPVIGLACVQEGEPDADVTGYTHMRLMGTLIDNFVPHGYAVAAVSVLGTGDSGHCMDLMGRAEQAGVQGAVEFLGESAWSNGNVGLIGRSYDGSTPWEAAMAGSEHLKTIVPISGLMGQYDLMWRNGSAETRGPGLLYALYAMYTQDGEVDDGINALCPDYLMGGPQGAGAYLAGSNAADPAYEYWSERYFYDDVVENYEGSIYYIHGMQDWNVDNHQAFPYYNQLLDEGFEMKGLFGQWDHAYPDRWAERERLDPGYGEEADYESVRFDWAQDLLEWFDHYLKETGDKPALHVEIQDNMGAWRLESEYPPRDAARVTLGFDEATALHDTPDVITGGDCVLLTGGPCDAAKNPLQYEFPPLSETDTVRIAGNVHFQPTVTPSGPGGQIGATLYDAETGLRLGHAIMDLRYYQGGTEMQTVNPGMPIVPKMEFFAMDVVLPPGHGLLLELTPTVMDYLPSAVTDPILVDVTDASTLIVPTVERDGSREFQPPQRDQADG